MKYNWDLSGNTRQFITADSNKVINLINITDSVKALCVTHTGSNYDFEIGGLHYTIGGNINKSTSIICNVINGNPSLKIEEYDNVISVNPYIFPSENRLCLFLPEGIKRSAPPNNDVVTEWIDSDSKVDSFKSMWTIKPKYLLGGVDTRNGGRMYCHPNGITLGNRYTMYSMIRRVGDGSILGIWEGQYFLTLRSNQLPSQNGCIFHPIDKVTITNKYPLPDSDEFIIVALTYNGAGSLPVMYVNGEMWGYFEMQNQPDRGTRIYFLSGAGDELDGTNKGFSLFNDCHSPLDVAKNTEAFKKLFE